MGLSFRQTKGEVYLTRNEGETVDVEVAIQVKGNSLTWYFWAEVQWISILRNLEIACITKQP